MEMNYITKISVLAYWMLLGKWAATIPAKSDGPEPEIDPVDHQYKVLSLWLKFPLYDS